MFGAANAVLAATTSPSCSVILINDGGTPSSDIYPVSVIIQTVEHTYFVEFRADGSRQL